MKTLSILLVFLLSFNVLAQEGVKYIDKDSPAPYNGYLFTIKKTQSVRKELIEKDRLAEFNKVLQENIKLQEKIIVNKNEQVKLLSDQNEKLAKEIDSKKGMSTFEKCLWFGLGVTAAGFAVYGAKQIVN